MQYTLPSGPRAGPYADTTSYNIEGSLHCTGQTQHAVNHLHDPVKLRLLGPQLVVAVISETGGEA